MNYKDLAKEFSFLILDKNYDKAYSYIDSALANQLTKDEMIESFLDMIEYFTEEGPCNITVEEPPVIADLGDRRKMVYVPIVSNNEFGESEALSIVFNTEGKIVELEFGRP